MNPYHLPVEDSSPYYAALAQCVDHWGLVPEKTELIRDGVNHVFATERWDGEPVIIRISDGAVRGRDEVLGELIWLEHLIRHGCTVTTPIPSRGGELLETVGVDEGGHACLLFPAFRGTGTQPGDRCRME